MQYTYKRNIQAHTWNQCCRGKAISITYSECVSVALVIQHAKRMRRIILSPVACLAVPYFSKLSHKQQDFREKKLLNIKRVLILWNISHSKKNWARYDHKRKLVFM
jgi:hypothetical protein